MGRPLIFNNSNIINYQFIKNYTLLNTFHIEFLIKTVGIIIPINNRCLYSINYIMEHLKNIRLAPHGWGGANRIFLRYSLTIISGDNILLLY